MFEGLKKLFGKDTVATPERNELGVKANPIHVNPPKHVSQVRALRRLERLYLAQQKGAKVDSDIEGLNVYLESRGFKKVTGLANVRKQLNTLGDV